MTSIRGKFPARAAPRDGIERRDGIDLPGLQRAIAGHAPAADGDDGEPVPAFLVEREAGRTPPGNAGNTDPPPRESDGVGADAALGVARNVGAADQVARLLDSARAVFVEIERDGLALIERQQQELAAFEQRVQAFVANGSTLASSLRDVIDRMHGGRA